MTDQRQRLRLTFSKNEQAKYIAHLDLMTAWERTLRRAQLPLAYSQGFNPRPKMQAASGLPLGTMGQQEILDIIITHAIPTDEVQGRVQEKLPRGLGLHAVEEVPLKAPTLQHLLREAEYQVVIEAAVSGDDLSQRINGVLAEAEIWQTRIRKKRKEQVNIRPWLHDLRLLDVRPTAHPPADASEPLNDLTLFMRLTAGQYGNLRPKQVLEALGFGEDIWRSVTRQALIFDEPTAPMEENEV